MTTKGAFDHLESTGIQARIKRAERMDLDYICKIYEKRVKDMKPGEADILEFFFRYHPDAFTAIDQHLKELELDSRLTETDRGCAKGFYGQWP